MIKKILIANRGEIASRIIRACKKLNIISVAIYSDADKDLPYVSLADEAYHVGESPVQKSYLNQENIFEIAKKAQVDAIHPGYGFLSENDNFAKTCQDKGYIFIGPTHDTIALMGDKIRARETMIKAGVPVVPGKHDIHSVSDAKEAANKIGYPIILKASAGGGGMGMEIAHSEEELIKSFEQVQSRSQQLFQDNTVYIEKYIEAAKHIEIQVFGDCHDNYVHLFERECTIQRRNQKVIEEALACNLSNETKAQMYEAALNAIKFLKYQNAGTIEFIVDDQENFYFLEMNTRIQVEHPVTEYITGLDLVAEQINVANKRKLSFKQKDIVAHGHAIEARIYAEDPVKFFPSPGMITKYEEPKNNHIRIENTITKNIKVTPYYDPMISKVIVHGNNRDEAINNLSLALENYIIEGIKTNIPMLLKVLKHPEFTKGTMKTDFVYKHL